MYGLKTINGGIETTTQTMPGGRVCLGMITVPKQAGGTVTTTSWPNISSGSYLRVMQIGAGAHTWAVSTNASGQATLTFTALSRSTNLSYSTSVVIFTTNTTEPDYGLALVNDNGQRTISTVYPTAEFLGIVNPSTIASYAGPTSGPYDIANHEATTSLGSGRNRIVLWSFPDQPGNDTWMNGTSFIPSGVTGNYNIQASIFVPDLNTTSYYIPQAFIFAIDGMVASSNQYGLRIWDNSSPQRILFDSGLNHMVVKGYETSLTYDDIETSFSAPTSLGGNQTAMFIPSYSYETWTSLPGSYYSRGKEYEGIVKKVGTTIYGKTTLVNLYFEDANINSFYTNGLDYNLTQVMVDAIALGGTTSFNLRSVPLDAAITAGAGSETCSYDIAYGQSSCTTSRTYTVSTTGGNGNAKSYSWSFLSNNGTLAFTTGTTGTSVTVAKTASQGLYQATLRCTVTQSGSNTAIVDFNLDRQHTEFNSGGGGGTY